MVRLAFVALAALIGEIIAAPHSYALDGLAIGSNLRDAIHQLGKPSVVKGNVYSWQDDEGGSTTATTGAQGKIVVLAVHASKNERRAVAVPGDSSGTTLTFYDSTHMSYATTGVEYKDDACAPQFHGQPCWVYTFPGDIDLLLNYGGDNGLSDWYLTDAILGDRSALARAHDILLHQ